MGAWQVEGTVAEDTTKQKGSFWDWWDNNGDTAVDAVGDVLCLINPNSPRCRPAYPPGSGSGYAVRQDNTVLYLLIGAVLFLLLLLILKK
ncbi:MAG: hypothetical protein R2824_15820 [Saprospiraceae bacterium]|nr:hypothetical protein [Lewinella sp.]